MAGTCLVLAPEVGVCWEGAQSTWKPIRTCIFGSFFELGHADFRQTALAIQLKVKQLSSA